MAQLFDLNTPLGAIGDRLVMLKAISNLRRLSILMVLLYHDSDKVPFTYLRKLYNANPKSISADLDYLIRADLINNSEGVDEQFEGCRSFYGITGKGKELLRSLKLTQQTIRRKLSGAFEK